MFHLCRMNQSRNQDFCPVCKAAIRGSLETDPFPKPIWVAPQTDDKLDIKGDKSKTFTATWKEGKGSHGQPECWHLELVDATGKTVWSNDVEGQIYSTEI